MSRAPARPAFWLFMLPAKVSNSESATSRLRAHRRSSCLTALDISINRAESYRATGIAALSMHRRTEPCLQAVLVSSR